MEEAGHWVAGRQMITPLKVYCLFPLSDRTWLIEIYLIGFCLIQQMRFSLSGEEGFFSKGRIVLPATTS